MSSMDSRATFRVECPSCLSEFPVDPAKVPLGEVAARCSACGRVFSVVVPPSRRSGDAKGAEDATSFEDLRGLASEAEAQGAKLGTEGENTLAGKTLSEGADRFGRRSPEDRAKHLARVLVSDIIAYSPEKHLDSLEAGTLKEDFEDEVAQSWQEYVDQVGIDLAESSPYFNEALNEILGKGRRIF